MIVYAKDKNGLIIDPGQKVRAPDGSVGFVDPDPECWVRHEFENEVWWELPVGFFPEHEPGAVDHVEWFEAECLEILL